MRVSFLRCTGILAIGITCATQTQAADRNSIIKLVEVCDLKNAVNSVYLKTSEAITVQQHNKKYFEQFEIELGRSFGKLFRQRKTNFGALAKTSGFKLSREARKIYERDSSRQEFETGFLKVSPARTIMDALIADTLVSFGKPTLKKPPIIEVNVDEKSRTSIEINTENQIHWEIPILHPSERPKNSLRRQFVILLSRVRQLRETPWGFYLTQDLKDSSATIQKYTAAVFLSELQIKAYEYQIENPELLQKWLSLLDRVKFFGAHGFLVHVWINENNDYFEKLTHGEIQLNSMRPELIEWLKRTTKP